MYTVIETFGLAIIMLTSGTACGYILGHWNGERDGFIKGRRARALSGMDASL